MTGIEFRAEFRRLFKRANRPSKFSPPGPEQTSGRAMAEADAIGAAVDVDDAVPSEFSAGNAQAEQEDCS